MVFLGIPVYLYGVYSLLHKDLSLVSSKDHGALKHLPIGSRVGIHVAVIIEGQLGKSDDVRRNVIILQIQRDFILAKIEQHHGGGCTKGAQESENLRVVSIPLDHPKVSIYLIRGDHNQHLDSEIGDRRGAIEWTGRTSKSDFFL